MLAAEDGTAAVRLARRAIDGAVGPHPDLTSDEAVAAEHLAPLFDEPRGVFVTLKRYPATRSEGASATLSRSFRYAPRSSVRPSPPRSRTTGSAVRAVDLAHLTVEVSVLTVPVPVRFTTPEEALRAVTVGRDGLIVEGLGSSGLLLPQVAPEQGWSVEELLEGTCEKAGLPPRAWRDPRVKLRRFEAEIFREVKPRGDVVREDPTAPTTGGPSARRT